MLSHGIPRPDMEATKVKLDRYDQLPLGLYECDYRRWVMYVTGSHFKWTSRRYPVGPVAVEIGVESGNWDYIENLIADTRAGWDGKPAEPIVTMSLRMEFIPRNQKEMFWTNYNRRGLEFPHIQSLAIEHDLKYETLREGISKRPNILKNPEKWGDVLAHYSEMNRQPRNLSNFMLPGKTDDRFGDVWSYRFADSGYEGGLGDGVELKIDKEGFKSLARYFVPKFRLARSSMSKKMPEVANSLEKKLFVDWLSSAAKVYEIPEQEMAGAIISIQSPIDFDLVPEEPFGFDFSSPRSDFARWVVDDIFDFFRDLLKGRRKTSIVPY